MNKYFKFPKKKKIYKKHEFLSIYKQSLLYRSKHFTMYKQFTNNYSRIGIVISKKYEIYSVIRNLIKRIIREVFRIRQKQLYKWNLLLCLSSKIIQKDKNKIKKICFMETNYLFNQLNK